MRLGIVNNGVNCFINSVLQSLASCPQIYDFFQSNTEDDEKLQQVIEKYKLSSLNIDDHELERKINIELLKIVEAYKQIKQLNINTQQHDVTAETGFGSTSRDKNSGTQFRNSAATDEEIINFTDDDILNQYQTMEQIEHIKKLPDTYIGSIKGDMREMWVYDDDKNMIVKSQC